MVSAVGEICLHIVATTDADVEMAKRHSAIADRVREILGSES